MDNSIDLIWEELEDFAVKSSGDRKTHVAACLVLSNGQTVFGVNHLRDKHGLSQNEISERIRPKFHDAMKCGEEDTVDKALELGLDLAGSKLYSLLFPCPRCAAKIANTDIKYVKSKKHRVSHNGKFDNPLEDSRKIFDSCGVVYDFGEPDGR